MINHNQGDLTMPTMKRMLTTVATLALLAGPALAVDTGGSNQNPGDPGTYEGRMSSQGINEAVRSNEAGYSGPSPEERSRDDQRDDFNNSGEATPGHTGGDRYAFMAGPAFSVKGTAVNSVALHSPDEALLKDDIKVERILRFLGAYPNVRIYNSFGDLLN